MSPHSKKKRGSKAAVQIQKAPIKPVSFSEHPIRVGAVSVVATAVFFVTVIIPIISKVQNAEIANLENKNSIIKTRLAEIEHLRDENKNLERKILRLQTNIDALRSGSIFSGGNPYPEGYRLVKVGDPISFVVSNYQSLKPIIKEDWVIVKGGNPLFDSATFYKSRDKISEVQFILFIVNWSKNSSDILLEKLIETFGRPDKQTMLDGEIWKSCWFDREGSDIELRDRAMSLRKHSKNSMQTCN